MVLVGEDDPEREHLANQVTIDADGSETIDDETTQTLPSQYDSIHIVSDGTEWWII